MNFGYASYSVIFAVATCATSSKATRLLNEVILRKIFFYGVFPRYILRPNVFNPKERKFGISKLFGSGNATNFFNVFVNKVVSVIF